MEQKQILIRVIACQLDELTLEERNLMEKAKEATQLSYAPYSMFQVGAAVLLDNGEVIQGSNQENAAYPSGLCAERVAMFYANSRFPNIPPKILAIAGFSKGDFLKEPISPCGSCRQVLLETEIRYKQELEVLLYGKNMVYKLFSSKELLPLAFDKLALK